VNGERDITVAVLAVLVQRAEDGDGDAEAALVLLLGEDWHRHVDVVAATDCDAR
jgi:hypothetical protein